MPETSVQQPADSRRYLLPIAVATGLYLVLCAALFTGIRHQNGGRFLFTLDDPYIHLALSQNLARGFYGLNPGEPASPSSSILWPFLLAPFARFSAQWAAPLVLNFLFGLATTLLIGIAVGSWTPRDLPRQETLRRALSAGMLVFTANLAGLTFIGMEHTLQVFLAAACALGLIACLRGHEIPWWCLAAAAIGPVVRYENLGITLAVAIALYGQDHKRKAASLLAIAIVPLIAFSAYLHHLGLPLFPMSVLIKGNMGGTGSSGHLQNLLYQLREALISSVTKRREQILTILILTLAGFTWNERNRVRRFALLGATAAALLHLLIGKFGWFFRYEIYIVFFSVLIVLYVLHERPRMLLGWYVLGLLGCSYLNLQAAQDSVPSAHDVYLQQYQTHRFTSEFFTGNVAVNDLGLVSYRHPEGQYIFDLMGLGSLEAEREPHKTVPWLDAVTREHNIGAVIVYSEWFPTPPPSWVKLGELCLVIHPVEIASACTHYYTVPSSPNHATQAEFDAFVKTLPPGIDVIKAP